MSEPGQNPFVAAKPAFTHWAALLLLVSIVLASFAASVKFGFINYDDPHYITENPHVNSGLSPANLKWALTNTGDTNLWSPLTFASHQLDVALFGLRPGWHHAVNVLWHALAAALFFLTVRKLTNSTFWAFFVALIWAIHPEKVQSVAWLSERKDVLSGAMFFASTLAFACWRLRPAKSPALYAGSLACFAMALLAKPSVVPLPLVLYLLLYLDTKRILASAREAALPLLPFFAASAAAAGIAIYFQSQGGLGGIGGGSTLAGKAMNMVVGYAFYLERFFWPSPAQLWFTPPSSMVPFAISAAALCILAPLLFWLGRKEKLIIGGAAIYTVLWLPVSGLVSVSHYFVADRYSYLPQIGLVFMLVGFVRLITRSAASVAPAGIVLGAFSAYLLFLQQQQLPLWKDSETLFSHEMAINPDSLLAPIHYAEVFTESDPEKALAFYAKAHRIDPQAGIALAKMGVMQKQLGRNEKALESFEKATQVAFPVRESWTQLLVLLVELKLYPQAEETIKRGIDADPDNWEFIMNSGNFYLLVLKQPDEALEYFLRAHDLAPADPRSIEACAESFRALGRESDARRFDAMLGN
ncbi:tetratricopeptide repeat protein [Akkermansiaceae bacterium]|nr:tetratricopeptide repeat protein [Akkermansiaceae bacterium]